MKKLLLIVVLLLLIQGGIYAKRKYCDPKAQYDHIEKLIEKFEAKNKIKDGDVIFQTSLSKQSRAIQLATHSQYSHCGIIYKLNNGFFVYEAVQPVKLTPLTKWIAKGQDGHFVIKRLKNADAVLTPITLQKMKNIGATFKGKNYDIYLTGVTIKYIVQNLFGRYITEPQGLMQAIFKNYATFI